MTDGASMKKPKTLVSRREFGDALTHFCPIIYRVTVVWNVQYVMHTPYKCKDEVKLAVSLITRVLERILWADLAKLYPSGPDENSLKKLLNMANRHPDLLLPGENIATIRTRSRVITQSLQELEGLVESHRNFDVAHHVLKEVVLTPIEMKQLHPIIQRCSDGYQWLARAHDGRGFDLLTIENAFVGQTRAMMNLLSVGAETAGSVPGVGMSNQNTSRAQRALSNSLEQKLSKVQLKTRGDFRMVMVAMLTKGLRTHGTALTLIPDDPGSAGILLRSLLELIINMAWIWKEPEARDYRTQRFVDYLNIEAKKLEDIMVWLPAELGGAPKLLVANDRQMHLYAEADRVQRIHNFGNNGFSGKNIREMAKEVGLEVQYNFIYKISSMVEHSGSGPTVEHLQEAAEGLVQNESPFDFAKPLMYETAYDLLIMLGEVGNDALGLGVGEIVEEHYQAQRAAKKVGPTQESVS